MLSPALRLLALILAAAEAIHRGSASQQQSALHPASTDAADSTERPPIMREVQTRALAALTDRARIASSAATPELLRLLGTAEVRSAVRRYVPSAAADTAEQLLDRLRFIFEHAEMLHNFEGGWDADLSVSYAQQNRMRHFPSSFEVRYTTDVTSATASAAQGLAEQEREGYRVRHKDAVANEGIFGLPPFGGDEKPRTYEDATSRLTYGALNLMRRGVGQTFYGDVAAVFHSRYRSLAAVAPMDSGMWTMTCNESYRDELDAVRPPRTSLRINCSHPPTPGVPGAMDHVILNYHRMRNVSASDSLDPDVQWRLAASGDAHSRDMIVRLLATWGLPEERDAALRDLGSSDAFDYAEANIFGNVHFADRGVKMLVANLNTLFGTERGQRLREWARDAGLVLTWAASHLNDEETSAGARGVRRSYPMSFRGVRRVIDPFACEAGLLNLTCDRSAHRLFDKLWQTMPEAPVGPMVPTSPLYADWRDSFLRLSTFDHLVHLMPPDYTVYLPLSNATSRECENSDRCLGVTSSGLCACFAVATPRPLGRSFLSTNPERAAEVYLTLFPGSQRIEQNISASVECADVAVVRRPTGETYTFVRDKRKPNAALGLPVQRVLDNVASSLRSVEEKRSLWSQWEDNHDGYGLSPNGFNVTRLAELTGLHYYVPGRAISSAGWQSAYYGEERWNKYRNRDTASAIVESALNDSERVQHVEAALKRDPHLMGVFRFWIPGSMWTGEIGLVGDYSRLVDGDQGVRALSRAYSTNPDSCRVMRRDKELTASSLYDWTAPWFKATAATSDPAAAQAFVVRYLGFDGNIQEVESPYESRAPNCHYAKWAVLHRGTTDTRPFMLHFVLSGDPDFQGGTPSVVALSDAVRRGRRISEDVFDSLMYNALLFWVDDLAPYKTRFDRDEVPYTIRGWASNGVASLLVQLPGAESVVELRSDTGIDPELVAGHPWDACSRELPPNELASLQGLDAL